jgi:hypothetical protein
MWRIIKVLEKACRANIANSQKQTGGGEVVKMASLKR